jgi:predicted phosphodiesterase
LSWKTCPSCGKRIDYHSTQCRDCYRASQVAAVTNEPLDAHLLTALRKGRHRLADLAHACSATPGRTLDALLSLQQRGINARQVGDTWSIEPTPEIGTESGRIFEYRSRPDHRFVFGAMGDTHLGSKYERLDCLRDLYDRFAAAGVDRVFHAGNWIDGEAPFNRFELTVHGMEEQLAYLAAEYPRRDGIETWAIAGEDHEGWYSRRESVDIGRFAEHVMHEHGRDDWHDLGFVEAAVQLVNAETGERSPLLVMHPGGGSAYAISYRPQRLLESLEGGEKPAVVLIGHYHKLSVNLIRNVWAVQVGCLQDQTVFLRKKNIEAHVGGTIVELEQDPATGAIIGCKVEMIRYFNQGYYNDRWRRGRAVVLPERARGAA